MIEILVASTTSPMFQELIKFLYNIGLFLIAIAKAVGMVYDKVLLTFPLNIDYYMEQQGITFHSVRVVIYTFSIYLIVLKFVKKLFDVYALQVDGDPNADINVLVTSFFKAMVVAMSFTTIWSWLYDIVIDFGTDLIKAINIETVGQQVDSLLQLSNADIDIGSPNTILLPVFMFLIGLMFLLVFKNAVEFWLVRLGVPLACCGLLDADQGLFKQYTKILLKEILTILIRVFMLHISLGVLAIGGVSVFTLLVSFSSLIVGFTTPKILSELLIQQQQGGRFMNTVYMGAMVLRGVI
mgnify:CR=1 FL=1